LAEWHLAPALTVLRAEINARWPNRDRASDGTVGDTAHAASKSDHNPNARGSVDAVDIDKDGVNISEIIRAAERHPSVHYWIFDRQIADRDSGFRRVAYSGPNPHDKHLHISIRQTAAAENDRRPWGLTVLDDKDKAWLESLVETRIDQRMPDLVRKAVWDGTLWGGAGAPSAKVAFQRTYTNAASTAVGLGQLANQIDDVDEQAIVAGVLAGFSPALIAAAIPQDIAAQVADELQRRLAG
jgi:hypothetical protein